MLGRSDLAPSRPSAHLWINPLLEIHEENGLRVAIVRGEPVGVWAKGDTVAEELFVVHAHEAGLCTIEEAGPALGLAVRTLYRSSARVRADGASAILHRRRGDHQAPGVVAARDAAIRSMCEQEGLSAREIARRLHVTHPTVLTSLKRQALAGLPEARQLPLVSAGTVPQRSDTATPQPVAGSREPEEEREETLDVVPDAPEAGVTTGADPSPVSSEVEPVCRSLDTNPLNRVVDRMLAAQGQLADAAPLFASGLGLPDAGVLLAIPGLVASALLPDARRLYSNIGPAFYGLRTSLVTFVLLALLRVKRPENLKELAPSDFGRIVGLDRAPEVKTLRRKLHRLAAGAAESLIAAIAERRVKAHRDALGFVYVDGHVRVYSGHHRVPQAHVTRMRISMPAIQDMWVNDADGRPVLHVTQEAHPSLASALEPVLDELRTLVGKGRFTVVFDRGGWSPALFRKLHAADVDVLTYRKGTVTPVPDDLFAEWPAPDGGDPWLLNDAYVRVPVGRSGFWMRQVTRRRGDHQTSILTTRQDLPPDVIARRMFARWKQENFFKYMREEYALDALVEYGAEDDDPERDVPDPAWSRADGALRGAQAELGRLLAVHRDLAHAEVTAADGRLAALRVARDALPRRTRVGDLANPPVRLPALAKRLSDALKTVAWHIESDLVQALAPHYRRSDDEGRTFIAAAFRSRGDLEVTATELRVTLAPQSSPHRTRALAALCAVLDQTETLFPGTRLRLRYSVRSG